MANIITAGNSSNGGTAISTDTSGTLNIVTGSGSGANAITIDASQAVTMPGNLSVTGNTTITGTLTATGGVSGGIRSGTAVATTSGTSIDFTSIPAGVKRITILLRAVSTNGSSIHQFQLGSGSVQTSGYTVNASQDASSGNYTTGFAVINNAAGDVCDGIMTFTNISGNIWIGVGFQGRIAGGVGTRNTVGSVSLSGVIDRIRYTTINGTDTFDAGSMNILWE
jgi:hypothetical protein